MCCSIEPYKKFGISHILKISFKNFIYVHKLQCCLLHWNMVICNHCVHNCLKKLAPKMVNVYQVVLYNTWNWAKLNSGNPVVTDVNMAASVPATTVVDIDAIRCFLGRIKCSTALYKCIILISCKKAKHIYQYLLPSTNRIMCTTIVPNS